MQWRCLDWALIGLPPYAPPLAQAAVSYDGPGAAPRPGFTDIFPEGKTKETAAASGILF